ncbi:MAG: mannose-1-phosphate guanylyltransferase/mannose-6-phosphate isomerase [Legionella sp.]|nr:MAG: mannose-1-phosphate guanylyltransferase/mannose-6-phosphate isomerase [Legionella sp.]
MSITSSLIYPVILSGGTGVRLWPLARQSNPKQLLNVWDHHSLLQITLKLVAAMPNLAPPVVVANEDHRFITAEQTKDIVSNATILLESQSADTALASALAARYLMTQSENPLLLVLPSDFYIPDPLKFRSMLDQASDIALQGKLVVFGINPVSAETNYGYIKKGEKLKKGDGYKVHAFFEKPLLEDAQSFVNSGEYYWNSGLFLFKAADFLQELEHHAPAIFLASQQKMRHLMIERDFVWMPEDEKVDYPKVSIDKAVFEKTKRAVVFPFQGEWYDLGNWKALYDIGKKDLQGNVLNEHVLTFATKNCYLYSNKALLVASGLEDCLVVATEDAIFVARLEQEHAIKEIVEYLKNNIIVPPI